ncbi:MAG: hypothetical protein ACR2NA_01960, partial [Solirubrobacterales bacterium]
MEKRSGFGRIAVGYRRTAALALGSLALVLVGLAPAAGTEAASRPAAAPFSNGVAKATAIVTRVAPGVGSLELALGSGIAVSELKNQLAQAQAQSFDLGLIGTTLTAEGCRDAAFTSDDLPQPTRVDNRDGDASATSDELPLGGVTLGAGRESAHATTKPSAGSEATIFASDGPAVSVGGGKATAVTEVVDGAARQARATVQASVTIAGVVELSGMRWEALHRTGKDPRAQAAFDPGTAELLGVPAPLDSLVQLQAAVNSALAETGITVEMPHVERFEEPTDLVRITPLRITLRDSPLGKTILGPGLNASREQREQLFEELSAAVCDAAGVLLVGDITVGVAAGTGFLVYDIGGAEAISGDFVATDPFGAPIVPPSGAAPTPAGGAASPSFVPGQPGSPGAPASGATAPPQPAASIGPLRELCESVHPFGWP